LLPTKSGRISASRRTAGTNFVTTSVVNFNNKAETTTFVSATQLTAAIPAADVATAGSVNVTVTNPAPGGSTSAATQFVIDGFTASGPAAPVSVKAGVEADFTITIKPTTNGFANPITFAVTGLPAHTTATFVPASVTPGATQITTTLKVMTIANGSAPPPPTRMPPPSRTLPLLALWLTALFACLYGWRFLRNTERTRRYAVLAPLLLLLVTGGVLAGCSGPVNHNGTPVGTSPLTVTATSGTLSQTTTVTLTVQ
jgi:hypothetical protein